MPENVIIMDYGIFLILLGMVGFICTFIGSFWFNKITRRQFEWRMGSGKMGFLLRLGKDRSFELLDFNPKESEKEIGDSKHIIDPDSVYRWGGVPVALANANHSPTLKIHDLTNQTKLWLDPTQMKAFIVRMRDLIEAKMARQNKDWRQLALLAAAICGVLAVILGYVTFENTNAMIKLGQQCVGEVAKLTTKFGG